MNACAERFDDALLEHVRGTLDSGTALELEAHTLSCTRCHAALSTLHAARAALEPQEAPPFECSRAMARLRERASGEHRSWRLAAVLAAAGAVVLIATARSPSTPSAQPERSAAVPSVVPTREAVPTQAALPRDAVPTQAALPKDREIAWTIVSGSDRVTRSGSRLSLAPRSRAVVAWGDTRLLLDTQNRAGHAVIERSTHESRVLRIDAIRAGLDVTPLGQNRELVVVAPSATVHVRGTRFSVDARGTRVVVSVDRGAVQVTAQGRSSLLHAGMKLAGRVATGIRRADRAFLAAIPSPAHEEPKRAPTARSHASLAHARALVQRRAYSEALAEIGHIRRAEPSSSLLSLDAELLEAQVRRARGEPLLAVEIFERIGSRADNRGERALFALGQTLASDLRSPERAIAPWRAYLARFRGGVFESEAQYQLGRALISTGEVTEALTHLRAFLHDYPTSAHADRARELMARYGGAP